MNITAARILQTQLNALGFGALEVDGRLGDASRTAIAKALESLAPKTETDWREWNLTRRDTLCLQALCHQAKLDAGEPDGWWGPQTEYATDQLGHLQENGVLPEPWRDDFVVPANPNTWPLERQSELNAYYGKPGKNLILLQLPYPLRLSWDTSTVVTRTQCNAKVKDSLEKVLAGVLRHYGLDGIHDLRLDLFGGGFNMRAKRGGSTMSTHAWGIAFDFDPMHNKLEWSRSRAAFAQSEYDKWWNLWEAEGWVSLGRSKDYDWMHVQAARV